MNLAIILVGLCLFAFHSAVCETTFALNNYVCSVVDGGFFTAQSKLSNQNETSYSVTIEFAIDTTYQTVISHIDFENIKNELCTYAYVVNNMLDETFSPKEFSHLMTFVMKTQLDFYLVESTDDTKYKLLTQLREVFKITKDTNENSRYELPNNQKKVSKIYSEFEVKIDDEVEEDIIEL